MFNFLCLNLFFVDGILSRENHSHFFLWHPYFRMTIFLKQNRILLTTFHVCRLISSHTEIVFLWRKDGAIVVVTLVVPDEIVVFFSYSYSFVLFCANWSYRRFFGLLPSCIKHHLRLENCQTQAASHWLIVRHLVLLVRKNKNSNVEH